MNAAKKLRPCMPAVYVSFLQLACGGQVEADQNDDSQPSGGATALGAEVGGNVGGVQSGGIPGSGGTPTGGTQSGGVPGSGGAPSQPEGTGGSPNAAAGGAVVQAWPDSVYSGEGTWVDGSQNTVGIQGAFFVIEDSREFGVPVMTPLQHTDLVPDFFDESTPRPCVSGLVAPVTASDGVSECGFRASDEECDFRTWGGAIGLKLNESDRGGTVKGTWDAVASGVTGFSFNVNSGDFSGSVNFQAKMAGSDENFCAFIHDGDNQVQLSDLRHLCWNSDGTEVLDLTRLEEIRWHLVPKVGEELPVDNFCVNSVRWF